MSVRFDASADRLLRTSDLLNYNAAYTVMFWFYFVSDLNLQTSIFSINAETGAKNDVLRTDTGGTQLVLVAAHSLGNNSIVNGSNASISTWYHGAIVRESATTLKFYLNGNLDATATFDMTTRDAPIRMEFGARFVTNAERFDGRVAAIKAWSTGLTQDQVRAEMLSYLPRFFTNPYAVWPCFGGTSERLRDYGSSLRNWTEGGTLSDEEGPPITWGLPSFYSPFVSSSLAPIANMMGNFRNPTGGFING